MAKHEESVHHRVMELQGSHHETAMQPARMSLDDARIVYARSYVLT